jgi:mRNA interferase MazF
MYRFAAPDKRRPVLVLSRPTLLEVMHTAVVAAVTRTIRGAPTEVELGLEEGLKQVSCVNLTNVFTVRQSELRQFIGTVDGTKMDHVCRALSIATACGA